MHALRSIAHSKQVEESAGSVQEQYLNVSGIYFHRSRTPQQNMLYVVACMSAPYS